MGPDLIAIAMGDVSNHGVGPALVMAVTRSQLHALLREKEISLKNIMLKLNEQLYLDTLLCQDPETWGALAERES